MNKILIVGNGFDRALGLKTSYSDFIIKVHKNFICESLKSSATQAKLFNITGITSNSVIDHSLIKLINDSKSIKEIKEAYSSRTNKQLNYNHVFLENICNQISDKKWVDIETEYFKALTRSYNRFYVQSKRKDPIQIKLLNECLTNITEELEGYLSYILDNFKITPDLVDRFTPLLKKCLGNIRQRNSRLLILNFNYTDTLFQITNHLSSNYPSILSPEDLSKITFVNFHGQLNNPANQVIFGYGNDTSSIYYEMEQEDENELLKKIKSIHYPKTHNYSQLINFINQGGYSIDVLGHSLGLSDKTTLKTLFESHPCQSIRIFNYNGLDEFEERSMNIARIFDDKEKMRLLLKTYDPELKFP